MEAIIQNILRVLFTYRIWVFVLLGIGFTLYIRQFLRGIGEWKKAVFELERQIVQRKLISASTGVILMFLFILGEFLLITIITPQISTQQLNLSVPSELQTGDEIVNQQTISKETEIPPEQQELIFNCVENIVDITYPTNGDTISGTINVMGSVNVDNFGSYKYEYSTTSDINWVTIAAGNQLKLNESIGFWHTSDLTPGSYLLQLMPLDNSGEELTPCIVTVDVVNEE